MDAQPLADEFELSPAGGDESVFVGGGGPSGTRVFGGLLVAQALRAAHSTVPDGRVAHSLHAGFVRAGTGGEPLRHEVETTYDGSTFSTRRVVTRQAGEVVFVLTADFQRDETGPEYEAPVVVRHPEPEGLPVGRYDTVWVESRDVPPGAAGVEPHARAAWFRARLPLPDDPALHQQALAFISDHGATRAVREPHVATLDVERRRSVSLDHAVWFHRPARVDEWLLHEFVPVVTVGGRGLARGSLRRADGTLVATVMQEAMLRIPS